MNRDIRKLMLEELNQAQLDAEYKRIFGEGAIPMRGSKLDAILEKEYPGPPHIHEKIICPQCQQTRPAKTSVRHPDSTGEKVVNLRCSVCGAWLSVNTGEHGESFQENMDLPDNTDFSDLK